MKHSINVADRNILLAAETWFGATGAGLSHGFRKDGWSVCEIDPTIFFCHSSSLLTKLLSRLSHSGKVREYNNAILSAAKQIRPQAFLTVKGIFLLPETLRKLSGMGVRTVNYYPDYHFSHSGLDQQTMPHYDFIVTTKSFQLDHLRNSYGSEHVAMLHHGYSDLVHTPHLAQINDSDYEADVTYIGNWSPYKEKWLKYIALSLPEKNMRIIGARWNLVKDQALKPFIDGRVLKGDFLSLAIQRSRINIAVHGDMHQPTGWQDFVSTRSFEIPACKGFMLHIDNAEIRSLFDVGSEIDVFKDAEEMINKIEYYLDRPEQRGRMIDKAYLRCVPAYGYAARSRAISEMITA